MLAWLGLGSNLQQPRLQISEAINRLENSRDLELLRISSFYRTPPWGDEQQDDFINAVVQIRTELEPGPLLRVLQAIENRMGRQRNTRRWGPRLIDIDLLLYGDLQYQSDKLEVPHARIHERAFVLVPLAELDAKLNIPGRGVVGQLLQKIDCSQIIRLPDESSK